MNMSKLIVELEKKDSPEVATNFTAGLREEGNEVIPGIVGALAEKYGFDVEEAMGILEIDIKRVGGVHSNEMAAIMEDTPIMTNDIDSRAAAAQPSNVPQTHCAESQEPNTLSQSSNCTVGKIQEENKMLKDKVLKLEQDAEMSKNKSKLLFRNLIKEKTGCSVPKATPEQLDDCRIIAENAIEIMKSEYNNVFLNKRVNECGNFMENIVDKADPRIIKPTNLQGRKKATGYPDREKENEAYLEIKILKEGSENSTYRSFYLSTFDKVTKSIPHILMAFTHNEKGLTNNAPKIIDIYDLEVEIKVEYNASNKTIYMT